MKKLYLAVVLMGGCFLGAADSHASLVYTRCMPVDANIDEDCPAYCNQITQQTGQNHRPQITTNPDDWGVTCEQGERLCACIRVYSDPYTVYPSQKQPADPESDPSQKRSGVNP